MANIDVDFPVEGIMTPQESVEKMLAVIPTKTMQDTGTFWTWEGKVSAFFGPRPPLLILPPSFHVEFSLCPLRSTHKAVAQWLLTQSHSCRSIRGDDDDAFILTYFGNSRRLTHDEIGWARQAWEDVWEHSIAEQSTAQHSITDAHSHDERVDVSTRGADLGKHGKSFFWGDKWVSS